MNNREWLYSLDVADLSDWFDAEHVETEERALDGGTEPENADSRERLEADAERYIEHAADYAYEDTLWADETFTLYDAIIELLDRQAAITERETKLRELYKFEENHREHIRSLEETNRKLNERIAELTAELDAAKQQISRFDAPKSAETSENPASKCEISDFDDSRDKLEADIRQYANPEGNTGTLGACWERKMLEFIDRQAAVTEEKTRYKWVTASAEEIAAWRSKAEKLQAQVDELKAERVKLRSQICKLEDGLVRTSDERDNWEANCEDWKKHARAAENACYETMLEREDYREKFGKCLDYADAIHALMDDEGMA